MIERDRDRLRQTERQRETERDRQTERQRERQREKKRQRENEGGGREIERKSTTYRDTVYLKKVVSSSL